MDVIAPSGLSAHDFIRLLEEENSTILFHELTTELNKTVGDIVNASSKYFTPTLLKIVGVCGKMPGKIQRRKFLFFLLRFLVNIKSFKKNRNDFYYQRVISLRLEEIIRN